MKKLFIIPVLLSACGVPQDTPGSVYGYNGHTVTVAGTFPLDGSPLVPTEAMRAQARDVCPGAEYLSATAHPTNEWAMLYLFRCK